MQIIASWPADMPLKEVGAWARRVEALGFEVMHVPEVTHDPFTVAALALTHTERLVVRTSMVVAFARSPMLTAYAAWDLARYSNGRFQLGLASQVRGNIVGRFSTEWSEPVARLRDYVDSVRAIFGCFQTGEPLEHVGPHYRFDRLQPYFNPGPMEHPAPEIWTGGVNRGMCLLAGERADGFVCHPTNSHPHLLRESIHPWLAEGAGSGRRTDGGPMVVAGPQPIMARNAGDLARAREARREELAFLYSTPAYRRQLELFGLEDVGLALSDMARRSDWKDLGRHLPDETLGRLVPQGTYDEIPTVLEDWYTGLCSGLVLTVPPDPQHDDAFGSLVERCKAIPV